MKRKLNSCKLVNFLLDKYNLYDGLKESSRDENGNQTDDTPIFHAKQMTIEDVINWISLQTGEKIDYKLPSRLNHVRR